METLLDALEKAKAEYNKNPTYETELHLVTLHELYAKEYWMEQCGTAEADD